GVAKIASLRREANEIVVNENKRLLPVSSPDRFMALEFDQGDVVNYLSQGRWIDQAAVNDHFGYASGALVYPFELEPAQEMTIYLAIPFHNFYPDEIRSISPAAAERYVDAKFQAVKSFWAEKLNHVQFRLPASADKMINTLRSNLAYILINRDGPGIQPGSRSYERSWIRDGAMTSAALLKMGITEEVRQFFDWYSRYQFPDGKIPCVVDRRGPDPVAEHDSHGEFIFGILNYFRFSGDTTFLKSKFEHVKKAVDYIEFLVSQRSTDYYKNGNDSLRSLYAILPESISHEGYSAKPMHSYWDSFWAMKGLKDAVTIAQILKDQASVERFTKLRDEFRTNLYHSLALVIRNHGIDYIPGCAELGDFDATSTSIAIYPCNELNNLPQPYLQNTFDIYFRNFQQRLNPDFHWENYTPYELRTISTFVHLNQKERAHEMLKFFFNDQRPQGWNHWAEVVWKDPRTPRFIGDMPHTWVGSDYINAVRSFFVFEDEADGSLVIGAGLKDDWVDAAEGMAVKHLPTIYGELNYSIRKTGNKYLLELTGEVKMPLVKIRIKNFKASAPKQVLVNKKPITDFGADQITIRKFPAVVEIKY
ncbi:MAG: coagulation factor 5/8 type domain-containing protein, partial [candidate division KSB1 bacterium]|nr:coagulation factor 5/8 type domain-containing protein [candidate division KSB1 bacterium]